ncbi:DsbA family oxidoreductase [Burkholderia cepacia]|uniref:DsbA family oxidoreductase n=1 Tax=Burkholderia cepacia TaxID=292 RepID=UPI002175ADB9|nr:DsbA family oxidoreductase [Burkholderia cepacia]
MKPVEVTVTYDLICPWCWIAEHRLAEAIEAAGLAGAVNVRFVPFELNPTMPAGGIDRKAYRSAKFGSWARSQALDAHVADAGRAAGLVFDHARIARTPNTRLAHRLVWFAQQRGSAVALVDALFAAYFRDGRDIGDTDVLVEVAAGGGGRRPGRRCGACLPRIRRRARRGGRARGGGGARRHRVGAVDAHRYDGRQRRAAGRRVSRRIARRAARAGSGRVSRAGFQNDSCRAQDYCETGR